MKQKTAAQHKLGTAPGSVTYTGTKKEDSITISGWIYDDKSVEPINIDLKQLPVPQKGKKIWIQVEGLHDIALIKKFGEHFKIHNLFLEDICNIHRNTSMDFIDPFVGIHLRHLSLEDDVISGLPLSVLANDNIVISFTETQEHPDILTPIEERLLDATNPMRTKSTYYLQYTMLDLVVDHYLLIL
ncbi:MAG TPA: hypothetical protein VIT68_03495, partial [Candidatus Gracilibacteria bacterium]